MRTRAREGREGRETPFSPPAPPFELRISASQSFAQSLPPAKFPLDLCSRALGTIWFCLRAFCLQASGRNLRPETCSPGLSCSSQVPPAPRICSPGPSCCPPLLSWSLLLLSPALLFPPAPRLWREQTGCLHGWPGFGPDRCTWHMAHDTWHMARGT